MFAFVVPGLSPFLYSLLSSSSSEIDTPLSLCRSISVSSSTALSSLFLSAISYYSSDQMSLLLRQQTVQDPSSPERFSAQIDKVEELNHITVFLTGQGKKQSYSSSSLLRIRESIC